MPTRAIQEEIQKMPDVNSEQHQTDSDIYVEPIVVMS